MERASRNYYLFMIHGLGFRVLINNGKTQIETAIYVWFKV